jgi:hypothetical protein
MEALRYHVYLNARSWLSSCLPIPPHAEVNSDAGKDFEFTKKKVEFFLFLKLLLVQGFEFRVLYLLDRHSTT